MGTGASRAGLARQMAAALAVAAVFAGSALAGSAYADETSPSQRPQVGGSSKSPQVDGDDPDLEMADGATLAKPKVLDLAKPKVLDIKSVVESDGGDQRREDSNRQVKMTLQAEVLFSKDSAKLDDKANKRITEIASKIKKQGASKVKVFGFTDNLGSYAHGKKLSKSRAQAVQQKLSNGLDGNISYQTRGYSEDHPIADNSTEKGRKKNRRVEVSFPRDN